MIIIIILMVLLIVRFAHTYVVIVNLQVSIVYLVMVEPIERHGLLLTMIVCMKFILKYF